MKKKTSALIVFLCFFVAACSLMKVGKLESNGKTSKVCGIPFYCKVNKYYHVTRYQQTIYLVSFQYRKTGDKEWQRETRKMDESQLILVKDWFSELPKTIDSSLIENKLSSFNKIAPTPTNPFPCELVANIVETRLELDTSKIYYLNQRMPLIGSSTLETELNPDGTLSKAKSTVESQTLAKVLEFATAAIPFKEFLSMKLKIPPVGRGTAVEFEINLNIESKIFLYTLSTALTEKEAEKPSDILKIKLELKCDNNGNCFPARDDISFEKKEIKPDTEKKEDKTEKKAIEFSGQIALPSEKK
jgi:hypothetical protein